VVDATRTPSPFPWNYVFPIILLTGQIRSTSPVISLVGGFGERLPASGTRATPKAQGTSCCECLPFSSAHPLHRSPETSSPGGFPRPFQLLGSYLVTKQGQNCPVYPVPSVLPVLDPGVTSAASRSQLPVVITSTAPAEAPGDGCEGGVRPRAPCSKYRCYAPWAISTPLLQRLADGPQ
jgi:hypothetical protein